jgi:hypothetical protein
LAETQSRPACVYGRDSRVRPAAVVEAHGARGSAVEGAAARGVTAAKCDPAVFVQNCLLQALDETVPPRVTGLGPYVADTTARGRLIEAALESLPQSVSMRWNGQPALAKERQHGGAQEGPGRWCVSPGTMARPPYKRRHRRP